MGEGSLPGRFMARASVSLSSFSCSTSCRGSMYRCGVQREGSASAGTFLLAVVLLMAVGAGATNAQRREVYIASSALGCSLPSVSPAHSTCLVFWSALYAC